MTCDQAAEFVSALFDGQRIPRDAAEHIGTCSVCSERLREYAVMSAELRREASGSPAMITSSETWKNGPRSRQTWWKNWRSSMRIPKLAFALMVLAIVVLLCGSIAIVRARSGTSGAALLVSVDLPRYQHVHHCALSLEAEHKGEPCAFSSYSAKVGFLFTSLRFIRKEGSRIELASKIKYIEYPDLTKKYGMGELDAVPETNIWISPEESAQFPVQGLGTIELTCEFLERMPILASTPLDALEPQKDEFRIVSPMLIVDKEVVANMKGSTAIANGNKPSVMLYAPGLGRLVMSGESFAGAIESKVDINQIEFNEDGHRYLIVSGMPVTRSDHVWILHEPTFRPSIDMSGVSDEEWLSTSGQLNDLLAIGKKQRK